MYCKKVNINYSKKQWESHYCCTTPRQRAKMLAYLTVSSLSLSFDTSKLTTFYYGYYFIHPREMKVSNRNIFPASPITWHFKARRQLEENTTTLDAGRATIMCTIYPSHTSLGGALESECVPKAGKGRATTARPSLYPNYRNPSKAWTNMSHRAPRLMDAASSHMLPPDFWSSCPRPTKLLYPFFKRPGPA